jgi:hypothetical protein
MTRKPDELGPPPYKALTKVAQHLQQRGYRISQSTDYKHHKQGLIRADAEGLYDAKAIDAYILAAGLKQKDGRAADQLTAETLRRKQNAETDKLIHQAEIARLKAAQMAGELVPRAEVAADFSARVAVFKAGLNNLADSAPVEIIRLVGGKAEKAAELTKLLKSRFEDLLDRYAQDREWEAPTT